MSYSSEVLADSPWCYYRLNESTVTTIADSSGNSNDGTLTLQNLLGVLPLEVFTQSGLVSDFDPGLTLGGNTQIETPVPPLSTDWTLEILLRANSDDISRLDVVRTNVLELVATHNSTTGSALSGTIYEQDFSTGPLIGYLHGDQADLTSLVNPNRHHVWMTQHHVVANGDPVLSVWVDGVLEITANWAAHDLPSHLNRPPSAADTVKTIRLFTTNMTIDEFAYYDGEVDPSRIPSRLAEVRNDYLLAGATETDTAGNIGYPRDFELGEAGLPAVFDPTTATTTQTADLGYLVAERALPIHPSTPDATSAATVPLGRATETTTVRPVVRLTGMETPHQPTSSPPNRRAFPPRRLAAR